jgi:hypothetical protein
MHTTSASSAVEATLQRSWSTGCERRDHARDWRRTRFTAASERSPPPGYPREPIKELCRDLRAKKWLFPKMEGLNN